MSYRFMRIIVMFDLPTTTSNDLKEYRKFRKFLIKQGFLMMQESIYSKIALNQTMAINLENKIKENKPGDGLVQILTITERQFSRIKYIVGDKKSNIIDSDERIVVL